MIRGIWTLWKDEYTLRQARALLAFAAAATALAYAGFDAPAAGALSPAVVGLVDGLTRALWKYARGVRP